ncbi:hypothetical protein RQP46_007944 [Phenoliferia psychrophenolica]
MLRLSRLPIPRGRLPALRRLASTATSASPSPSPYSSTPPTPPPPSPLRPRTSLYSQPTLPPIAAPLPVDGLFFSSPHLAQPPREQPVHEQLAVLDACLNSGEITRAEEVASRINQAWARRKNAYKQEAAPDPGSLAELLPPRVHADFLRAYLQKALALNTAAETSESARHDKTVWIAKAWAYFDTLTDSAWWVRTRRAERNGAIDKDVLAVLLKGLVRAGPECYNPPSDSRVRIRRISTVLSRLDEFDVPLAHVLRSDVFSLDSQVYLGSVSPEEVLNALEESGSGGEVFREWEGVISSLRDELRGEQDRREAQTKAVGALELDPTRSKDLEATVSLQNLRENLSALATSSHVSPADRQRALEASSYDAAQQLYLHEVAELTKAGKNKERGMQGTWLQGVMWDWMRKLRERLDLDKAGTGPGNWSKETEVLPMLRVLGTDKMALITIVELLRLSGAGGVSDGMKSTRAIIHIGRAIETEYRTEKLAGFAEKKAEFTKELDRLADNATGARGPSAAVDFMWKKERQAREVDGGMREQLPPDWTQGQRAKIGAVLISALSDVATVERSVVLADGTRHTETQPAFSHAYQYVRGQKLGIIRVNSEVAERMETDPLRMTLHPRFLPMVVKPKTWTSYNHGSYLSRDTYVMRTKDNGEQVEHLKQASDSGNLDHIFEGLDVLGSVAWKINRPMFDIISEVWNTGEPFADIPQRDSLTQSIDVEKPAEAETDPRARDTYRQRIKKALQERRSAHSNRCDVNYKLEIARAFLGEKFFFPHNLDFRGRAYPIPPNLSHIGNDLCRGILMFADAKPLGDRGLRWLKIHLANMTGFDKASFDEREAFAMEHLEDVYDSVDHPLDGKRWWLKAEDPWQCLATCMELAAALRSPVPTEFMSSLPVHQDGTCNGLQHYAALGGDLAGAHQVNLDGGDRPADVYSGVARMANAVIDKDVLDGNEYAIILQGKVTRKVVKQTVMTTVYGVTFIGAKKQIAKQLKERGDIPIEKLYMCSLYLSRIVLDSIGDVFAGATAIQTWLNRSARLIAKSIPVSRIPAAVMLDKINKPKTPAMTGRPTKNSIKKVPSTRIPKEQMVSVAWTTPLGLPVVQPYRKEKKRQVATTLQTVYITDPSIPAEVDARAQATAFPPNFIHSLDATHMMMTALACKDKLAFASVHDSYWTHACSVDEMSTILRDTFIELHSQDILEKLRAEFVHRYQDNLVPVSKVPAGISFSVHDGEKLVSQTGLSSKVEPAADLEDVYSNLEREDGDVLTPLFKNPPKVRRASAPSWDDEGDDVGMKEEQEDEQSKFTNQSTSNKANAKFVKLSDILPPVPSRGTFDLEKIRDSLYFFS